MTVKVNCITVDCTDTAKVADFWAEALGWGRRGNIVEPPGGVGPYLEFIEVPEAKTLKNRLHFGLDTSDLEAEIQRLTALGAELAWEEDFPDHWRYRNVVLRDPEGNEFCLGTSRAAYIRSIVGDVKAVVGSGDDDRKLVESLDVLAFHADLWG